MNQLTAKIDREFYKRMSSYLGNRSAKKAISGAEREFQKKRRIKRFHKHIDRQIRKWATKTKSEVIAHLRIQSDIIVRNHTDYRIKRKIFNAIKWRFYKIWRFCGACKSANVEHLHHIILLKNGGSNNRHNIIGLCRDCHELVHDWMKPNRIAMIGNKELEQQFYSTI